MRLTVRLFKHTIKNCWLCVDDEWKCDVIQHMNEIEKKKREKKKIGRDIWLVGMVEGAAHMSRIIFFFFCAGNSSSSLSCVPPGFCLQLLLPPKSGTLDHLMNLILVCSLNWIYYCTTHTRHFIHKIFLHHRDIKHQITYFGSDPTIISCNNKCKIICFGLEMIYTIINVKNWSSSFRRADWENASLKNFFFSRHTLIVYHSNIKVIAYYVEFQANNTMCNLSTWQQLPKVSLVQKVHGKASI